MLFFPELSHQTKCDLFCVHLPFIGYVSLFLPFHSVRFSSSSPPFIVEEEEGEEEELINLFSFFHFILLFWNQILICRSVRQSACAISMRRRRVRYRLKWNSFSSSRVWQRVYVCRPRLPGLPKVPGREGNYKTQWKSYSLTQVMFLGDSNSESHCVTSFLWLSTIPHQFKTNNPRIQA